MMGRAAAVGLLAVALAGCGPRQGLVLEQGNQVDFVRADDLAVTCYRPAGLPAGGEAAAQAEASGLEALLKQPGSVYAKYEPIKAAAERPSDLDAVGFVICRDYGRDGLTVEQYKIDWNLMRQLIEEMRQTPTRREAVREPPPVVTESAFSFDYRYRLPGAPAAKSPNEMVQDYLEGRWCDYIHGATLTFLSSSGGPETVRAEQDDPGHLEAIDFDIKRMDDGTLLLVKRHAVLSTGDDLDRWEHLPALWVATRTETTFTVHEVYGDYAGDTGVPLTNAVRRTWTRCVSKPGF